MAKPSQSKPFRVAVIGGGLSGLCLANALLGDSQERYDVQIYERDTATFDSERGGYQIRLGADGIDGLKTCLAKDTYEELKHIWGSELSRAPAVIDPFQFKVVAKLASLKLYPQTRAVPRQALKEYLLKLPLKRGIVNFSHRLTSVSYQTSATGETEVVCKFDNGKTIIADLLVGADGARSTVNSAMGINNVRPVEELPIIQGRCEINDAVYAKLPPLLRENGSFLFFTQKCHGFCAVYDAYNNGKRSENESFLFWGIHLSAAEQATLPSGPGVSDKEKCTALAEKFEAMGLHPDGLPTVIRCGDRNVKTGTISSSTEPVNWRSGDAKKGHVILIGDGIHAMTPGRGQGANQAMKDGAELAKALLARDMRGSSDAEMLQFANAFDDSMFKRAFPWVKASEQAFTLTTDTLRGYYTITIMYYLLQAAGMGASALEAVGLKSRYVLDF